MVEGGLSSTGSFKRTRHSVATWSDSVDASTIRVAEIQKLPGPKLKRSPTNGSAIRANYRLDFSASDGTTFCCDFTPEIRALTQDSANDQSDPSVFRRRSCQQSPSAAAAAATFVATSRIDRSSPVVNPDRAASRGLASRRASNVVPWAMGITRSVARRAESSLSATPWVARLLSSAGVTSTMPIREVAKPLSISRRSDLPRPTSFSLNQTVAPRDVSRSHSSFAAPLRSSQAWHRKRSRRSGWLRAYASAFWARGSIVRHSTVVYITDAPPRRRRDLPPLDDARPYDATPTDGYLGGGL